MNMYYSMREFLDTLEKKGRLKYVDTPLKAKRYDSDLDPFTRYLQNINGPAVVMTNLQEINKPDIPVVMNLFGSYDRVATALDCETYPEAIQKHMACQQKAIPPVMVERDKAPCKDVIIKDDIDLRKIIPMVWFGKERQVYLTSSMTFSKDPDTGLRHMGWYRTAMLDVDPEGNPYPEERQKTDITAYYWYDPPMSDVGRDCYKTLKQGKKFEVALAFFCDPALHIAAATSLPSNKSEIDFAGALRGAPVEMVKCETIDVDVPATAEWVFECEMLEGEKEVDGPHGNSVGYLDKRFYLPVLRVKCITHRKNPMMYYTYEMKPPYDHSYITNLTNAAEVLGDIQPRFPQVKDCVVHPLGRGNFYVIQLNCDGADKPHPEFGKTIIHAVWSTAGRWGRTAKFVVVVGPDIDPYDLNEVIWALVGRVQPVSDVITVDSGPAMLLDPSAPRGPQNNAVQGQQMGIDALIKVPERFTEYDEVAAPDPERVKAVTELVKSLFE